MIAEQSVPLKSRIGSMGCVQTDWDYPCMETWTPMIGFFAASTILVVGSAIEPSQPWRTNKAFPSDGSVHALR